MTDYGHELQFGTFLTPANADPQVPVQLARLTERAGLDLATFQDHPYQPAFLDTWTLLTWVAAATERITVSGNVLNLPLRPPAVLARSAASLDLLSGGRFAMGLGAGGFWDAIEAMGGPRRSPGEAVEALEEALRVMRGIWDPHDRTPLRVPGDHYRVAGAKRGPEPAHDIPVWLGAYKPRMLRLIGRQADGWLPSLGYMKDGDLARGNAVIDEAAAEAGRDPAEIRRLLNLGGAIRPTSSGFLQGPVDQWIEELTRLALEDGIGTFIFMADDPELIETLGGEIAPAVREAVAAARRAAGTTPASARRGTKALAARRDGIDYGSLPADLAERAVEPGDREYESVRHNYLREGAPGIVLRPRGAGEIVSALDWSREQAVPFAVRSAGHGISGRSTNDGGIVLDLGALRSVEVVDEATRRVRIGAGATWGEVAEALAPRRWAITSGDYGGVGVGGLGTTGGIGFLGRLQGLTIDRVVAAEMVTASGDVLRVSADEHPDLFWALRGAGGNMGVVTWLEVRAGEVGDVVFSQMTLDATDTAGLLEKWGAAVEAAPRGLTSFLYLAAARRDQGPLAQLMTMYAAESADADPDAAIAALETLADAGPLLAHQAQLLPYSAVVSRQSRHHSGGGTPAARSGLLAHLDRDASRAVERLLASGASHFTAIRATGGAVHDVDPDSTAYAHRHQNFALSALSSRQSTINEVWDAEIRPVQDGSYLSFDTDTRPERLLEAFPEPTLSRLREVKATYDPANVFRSNFPIPPAELLAA
ncbi:LLM class flavin-dependent oxidoreductase [Myceligenerans pegani]|uniref:LLM class flavin-dependent oxidoreductase n=1 Tax=Myceligenerans pegani TaxID=2776917 RepID=A0ABR9MTS1_9MICO|nr:LLM class flavin-dependent oxidoreductase [Myceligenerans sp. TRM 65318]MBE1874466.1 LLM class flavin-dependent oxidoreductase [Myceligenerans sp. TRM 65318]MBE3016737.1 LLM class flavin-dependent oxidoreductase [Myceligenerans sp. TRM 65318]